MNTSGSSGGRNNNTIFPGNCHGPGGGGGGGLFAFSGGAMPGTITYVTLVNSKVKPANKEPTLINLRLQQRLKKPRSKPARLIF